MYDDTVRVEDAFTVVSGAPSQTARGTVALENPPLAMPHADSVTVGGGAGSSFSPTCTATATAPRRTQRHGEAIQQAAQLASWEDEGGTTSS